MNLVYFFFMQSLYTCPALAFRTKKRRVLQRADMAVEEGDVGGAQFRD